MAYLDVGLNFRFNFRFKKRARTPKWRLFWTFRNICDRFIYTLDMERLSKINPQKVRLMLMTLLMTSQRDVKVGWIQEMDTYSAYLSKSQYIQSYWFSNQSDINIIYNISVITIIITTSIIWQVCSSDGLLVCLCLSVTSSIQVTVFDISLPNLTQVCIYLTWPCL